MGIESRSYYREEPNYGFVQRFGNGWSMVTWIIVINVAVFVLDMFTPIVRDGGAITHWLGDFLALHSDRVYYVWTWLTYGFTHAPIDDPVVGFWHIAGNMLTLFFLGRAVEMRMGSREFLSFYLLAVVVSGLGAIAISLLQPGGISLVGASGAVTAVVAVFILWFPKQTLLIWGVLPVPAWVLGLFIVFTNLRHAFTPGSHVSWEAHAIGAAFGLAYVYSGMQLGTMGLDRLSGLFSGRPKLRLHNPEATEAKLQVEADRILKKINESGEASLTARERRTLNKYSRSLRNRK